MSALLLRQVDDASRADHGYLEEADTVFYLREYTSHRGWSYGDTNSLISNLKKPMNLAGTPQWPYKAQAISRCAHDLRQSVRAQGNYTWVPVPPSKAPDDPLYDDRLVQILRQAFPLDDVRELVFQPSSTAASHTTGQSKPPPGQLAAGYRVNTSLGVPRPAVVIFDDILTTGSHFKAMQRTLVQAFPGVVTYGLFIARRVFPDDDQ